MVGRLAVGGVLVVVVAGIGYFMSRNDAQNASVGDCLPEAIMTAPADETVETTDCAGPDAAYRVVGTYQQTEMQFTLEPAEETCSEYPTAESAVWIGERGRTGTVLCLETITQ